MQTAQIGSRPVRVAFASFFFAALAGCNEPAKVDPKLSAAPSQLVRDLIASCFGANVLGTEKLVVFLGPNEYSPGDLWSRVQTAEGTWIYDAQFDYAGTVGKQLSDEVVVRPKTPVDSCSLKVERKAGVDAKAEAQFTASALPAKAKANFDYKRGAITSIKADKAYLDHVKFYDKYRESWLNNPGISPTNAGLKAVQQGTVYVSASMLRVQGYTVEVQYGSDIDAGAGVGATLLGGEKEDLSAEVKVTRKADNKLEFKIGGEVQIAAVFRKIGPGGALLSGTPSAAEPIEISFGTPKRRSGFPQ